MVEQHVRPLPFIFELEETCAYHALTIAFGMNRHVQYVLFDEFVPHEVERNFGKIIYKIVCRCLLNFS